MKILSVFSIALLFSVGEIICAAKKENKLKTEFEIRSAAHIAASHALAAKQFNTVTPSVAFEKADGSVQEGYVLYIGCGKSGRWHGKDVLKSAQATMTMFEVYQFTQQEMEDGQPFTPISDDFDKTLIKELGLTKPDGSKPVRLVVGKYFVNEVNGRKLPTAMLNVNKDKDEYKK